MVQEVTDPKILAQLEGDDVGQAQEVTDPAILSKLEPERYGMRGIGQDVLESLSGLPEAGVEMLQNLVQTGAGGAKYAATHSPHKTAQQVALGLGEDVAGLLSGPQMAARYLSQKLAPQSAITRGLTKTPTPFELAQEAEQKLGIDATEEQQPVRGLGGLLFGGKALTKLPGTKSRIGGLSTQAAGMGGDPLQAALLGGIGEGAVSGAKKIPEFASGRLIKSPLTDQQLEEQIKLAGDEPFDIGNLVENAPLQHLYENVLSKTPGSKVSEQQQQVATALKNQGRELLEKMEPNKLGSEDLTGEINSALQDAFHDVTQTKGTNYDKVNDIADKQNVKTDRSNFRRAAQERLKRLESDPDLSRFVSGDMEKTIREASTPEGTYYYDYGTGERKFTPKLFSIRDSDFLRSDLNKALADARATPGQGKKVTFLSELVNALNKDIDQAIDTQGSIPLKKARDKAHSYYKENYAPFLEKDVYKFIKGRGDPDQILQSFLKTSRAHDRGQLLNKLHSKLPEDSKNLIPLAYFSSALKEGEFQPLKFKTLYNSLGPKQKQIIFGEQELAGDVRDYVKRVNKATEPLTQMLNLKTGQRATDFAPFALGALATKLSGLPAAAAGIAGGRSLSKLLTNPKTRDALIKRMIEARKTPKKELPQNIEESLRAALQASNIKNQNE